jgi:hypothetical protein
VEDEKKKHVNTRIEDEIHRKLGLYPYRDYENDTTIDEQK